MDIRLQGEMDGIAAADYIRAKLPHPGGVPHRACRRRDAARGERHEAFGYIIKPASERELRVVIEMALYKHAAEQQAPAARAAGPPLGEDGCDRPARRRHAHDFNNIPDGDLSNCRTLAEQLPAGQPPHKQVLQIGRPPSGRRAWSASSWRSAATTRSSPSRSISPLTSSAPARCSASCSAMTSRSTSWSRPMCAQCSAAARRSSR